MNSLLLKSVALSAVISKFKRFRNIGFNTFTKLYYAGVNTILDYGASVWDFSNYKFGQQIQNMAIKYLLGVHKNAPIWLCRQTWDG